jgi:hypothetical protein
VEIARIAAADLWGSQRHKETDSDSSYFPVRNMAAGNLKPDDTVQFGIYRTWAEALREYRQTCKICCFHGGDYEEWGLLGRYAVWLL